MRPSVVARARRAAERAWSARLGLIRRARAALPVVKELGTRAAERVQRGATRLLPQAKTIGARTAQLLPRASRLLPSAKRLTRPVRRALPRAGRWARSTVRSAPRSLVIAAPFVALIAIWLVHSVAARHRHPAELALSPPSAAHVGTAPAAAHVDSAPSEPVPVSATVLTPTATLSPPAPPTLADDAELRMAVAQGLPAMAALAAKYAADPQVLLALASAEAQAQRYDSALATIERALDASPSAAQNGKLMGILWRAAQSSAAEESFACMRRLGARGSDIEFDLATTAGVRESVRERAKTELSNNLALDASADTRAATALLLAPDCASTKALLLRAERDGGKRTLAMLERFSSGTGCSSSTDGACNACLLGSPALAQAISKLSAGTKP
jgi:tetratricopeptide (TPR) repeat protein